MELTYLPNLSPDFAEAIANTGAVIGDKAMLAGRAAIVSPIKKSVTLLPSQNHLPNQTPPLPYR